MSLLIFPIISRDSANCTLRGCCMAVGGIDSIEGRWMGKNERLSVRDYKDVYLLMLGEENLALKRKPRQTHTRAQLF